MDISSTALRLWHGFWALPLTARIIAFVVPAAFAWIKKKAIGETGKAVKAKFWGWVSGNVQSQPRQVKRVDLRLVLLSPLESTWGIGAKAKLPTMTLRFRMNFAHGEDFSLIINSAYIKGTQPIFTSPIVVEGSQDGPQQVMLMLSPVKATSGKPLKAKIIFVDQFNNLHVSEEITFLPSSQQIQTAAACFFCGKAIESGDQAPEAAVPAHKTCIWP